MRSDKIVLRLTIALGIISWSGVLLTNLVVISDLDYTYKIAIPPYLRNFFLDLFLISLFFYFKFKIEKAERIYFLNQIWRVFVTGLIAAIIGMLTDLSFFFFQNSFTSPPIYIIQFFYHLNLGIIAAFLITTLIAWKRLILYQKTKKLLNLWTIFEYALLGSIFLNFLPISFFDPLFQGALIIMGGMGLFLSGNLKWVAYLNFKEKWKSIFLMLAIAIFIAYSLISLFSLTNSFNIQALLIHNLFIASLFIFSFIYSIFSLLVILFNLPTSSVFEQKLEEIINFQRLSQTPHGGHKVDQVFEILLDSAYRTVFADCAWLEVNDDSVFNKSLLTKNLDENEVYNLKNQLRKESPGGETLEKRGLVSFKGKRKDKDKAKRLRLPSTATYRSVLWIPLVVKNTTIGSLVLLKEVPEGFNTEMISIIGTFASQACISVENFQLLDEAIQNERYQEELKIASRIQQSLLPPAPIHNGSFSVAAFSKAADQVGGDYYDIIKIDEYKFALIIGDVSGKGTTAAFNMSQMRGIFHSLAQLNFPPDQFLHNANKALSRCLEKSAFITVSYFIIDTNKNILQFARAGHCPSLYFHFPSQKASYIESEGMGLGIIRNDNFKNYIEVNHINYNPGDLLILYTDGIIEARNHQKEQFGYERLKNFFQNNNHNTPEVLQNLLIEEVHNFCNNKHLDDDYTALIIKFN